MTRSARLVLAALLAIAPAPLAAQGNQSADNLSATGSDSESSAKGIAAHAGADTTNGSTTGFIEPPSPGGGGGGPPVHSAEMCSGFEGQPAHDDCLSKVLGEREQP